MLKRSCIFALALMLSATIILPSLAKADTVQNYDVVVYGATPSGVMAAIQAERLGKSAVIIEPSNRIGGMVTGGLSAADIGVTPSVIGGVAKEFFNRIATYYGKQDTWYFEPKVASQVMTQMVNEAGVTVITNQQIAEGPAGVTKTGTTINSLTTTDGTTYSGKQFIDASYEGDLMADAGVSYTTGREAKSTYGESLAGVQPVQPFNPAISAYDANGNLYPLISTEPLGAAGSADNHIQSYNFRITSTNVAANRIPYPKPDNYDPQQYALLAAWLPKLQVSLGRDLGIRDVIKISSLPHGKFDTNNLGPLSTDFINGSAAYPNGTYTQRAAIYQQTKDYDMGLLYFLQNDPSVPTALHADMANYGLAKDEFVDSSNWPTQMYVREGRRMIGDYVMRQQDLQTTTTKKSVVALGSYKIDQHVSYRGVNASGQVVNEGGMYTVTAPTYAIPYTSITPQASQATNLLVTGTPSASHVAWAGIRMEPQFMMLGQAAGDAASLAIDQAIRVQSVSYTTLQQLLQRQGAVLSANQAVTTITDNNDAQGFQRVGNWTKIKATQGIYGNNYFQSTASQGAAIATWSPNLSANGSYNIYARVPVDTTLASAATYAIVDATGQTTNVTVNQQSSDGRVLLGTFNLHAGHGASVKLTVSDPNGPTVADAIEFAHT